MARDPSAQFWCDACQLTLPGDQVEDMRAGATTLAVCPKCKRALIAQNEAAKPTFGRFVREREADDTPFPMILARALLYPFRPTSLIIVGGISVFAFLVTLAPVIGSLASLAVQIGMLFQLVRATSEGHEEWNEAPVQGRTFSEWLVPLLKYAGVMLVAAAPAIVVLLATGLAPLAILAGIPGLIYLPAGLIAASFPGGCLGPLNPLPAIALIARIPAAYAITLGFLVIALVLGSVTAFVGQYLIMRDPVPFLAGMAGTFLRLLGPVAMARMLGLLVREHAEELFGA